MAPQIIGAGLGRTGTLSLKRALERLLGGTCHHMVEVGRDREQRQTWNLAYQGQMPDWTELLDPYCAIVDWPGATWWRELAAAFPDAPVLLSTRDSADTWFRSARSTIFDSVEHHTSADKQEFPLRLFRSFCADWPDEQACKDAYDAHNQAVRAAIDPSRLVEYQPGDGWTPLCQALGLPEPQEPFPHVNTTEQFHERFRGQNPARSLRTADQVEPAATTPDGD